MADKLNAARFGSFSQRNITVKAGRTALIDNDSIGSTAITDRVKKWGKIKFEVSNKHPLHPGPLRFPVLTLTVDNHDGYFDMGGTVFPNGLEDVETTYLVILVQVDNLTVLNLIGYLKEPEYSDKKSLRLVVEHPLSSLTKRKWTRSDRIGGDTGIDFYFDS